MIEAQTADSPEVILKLERFDRRARQLRRLGLFVSFAPILLATATFFSLRGEIRNQKAELDRKHTELDYIRGQQRQAERELESARQEQDDIQRSAEELRAQIDQLSRSLGELTTQLGQRRSELEGLARGNTRVTTTQLRQEIQEVIDQPLPLESRNRTRARELWNKGWLEFNQNKLSAARESYTQSTNADPTYAPPVNSLGRLAEIEGNHPRAVSLFEQAVRIDGNYVPALDNLARAYLQAGRISEARALINRALSAHPGHGPSTEIRDDISNAERTLPGPHAAH